MSLSIDSRPRIERLSRRSRRVVAVVTMLGLPAMYRVVGRSGRHVGPDARLGPGELRSDRCHARRRATSCIATSGTGPTCRAPGSTSGSASSATVPGSSSYQVLAVVVVVLGAAVVIPVLGFGRPVTIDAQIATAIALCLGVLLPLLPAATLAWLEPDPIEEP